MTITTYLPLVAKNYTHPLLNGNFETIDDDFAAYWEHEGDLSVSTVDTLSNGDSCSSGTHCVILGSPDYPCNRIPLGYGRVYQTFGVPLTGTPKLSFDYRIFSYDESGSGRFDSLDVYLDDSSDEVLPILVFRDGSTDGKYGCDESNLDDMGWKNSSESKEIDLSAVEDGNGSTVDFRGKTVRLSFDVYSRELDPQRTWGWYNTWIYLDNVQIKQD